MSDENELRPADYTIYIVCDSLRHVRGKITKIATYLRNGDRWSTMHDLRARRVGRHVAAARLADADYDIVELAQKLSNGRSFSPCKLCGGTTPKPDAAVLNYLEENGVSQISIKQLAVIASLQR